MNPLKFIRFLPAVAVITLVAACETNTTDDVSTVSGVVLDIDSRQPVAGASVYYFYSYPYQTSDTVIADVNGRYTIQLSQNTNRTIGRAEKAGYVFPPQLRVALPAVPANDTIYIGRPSFVNLTLHQQQAYQPGDSISFKFTGAFYNVGAYNQVLFVGEPMSMEFTRLQAGANNYTRLFTSFYLADSLINAPLPGIPIFYGGVKKMHFTYELIRNGNIISTARDSADLIRFGTKQHTINY